MSSRLGNAWNRQVTPVLNKIVNHVKEGDFVKASDLVQEIDLEPVVARNTDFIRLIGMSAALFGVSKVKNPRGSKIHLEGETELIKNASNVIGALIGKTGTREARKLAERLIAKEEADQKEASISKAATPGFVTDLPKVLKRAGRQTIDLASSLHTSRLAQWGFLVEADVTGHTTYEISEVLDSRTCPVCDVMHGKAFVVSSALDKVERQLSVTDPDELKSIAPWPKQDKASVAALRTMSPGEMISRGYDTPPFHPLCRGILVKTDQVVELGDFHVEQIPLVKPTALAPDGSEVLSVASLAAAAAAAVAELTIAEFSALSTPARISLLESRGIEITDEVLEVLDQAI